MKQKNNELEIKVKYLEEEKIKIKDEMKEIKELINQLKLEIIIILILRNKIR